MRNNKFLPFMPIVHHFAVSKNTKSIDKPGSVLDSHLSRHYVTIMLKQPTRLQCEPHYDNPIWLCFRWGLPCHFCYQKRGVLLPHRFTLTHIKNTGGLFSVALSVSLRFPGVTWHLAL